MYRGKNRTKIGCVVTVVVANEKTKTGFAPIVSAAKKCGLSPLVDLAQNVVLPHASQCW